MKHRNLKYSEAVFAEHALKNAVDLGATQYIIFSTVENYFAYHRPCWATDLKVFEVMSIGNLSRKLARLESKGTAIPDRTFYIEGAPQNRGWRERLNSCEAYSESESTVCSLMGVSPFVEKSQWKELLSELGTLLHEGDCVVMDYLDSDYAQRLTGYTERELEEIASSCGFRIYEHVNEFEMKEQYLRLHNLLFKQKVIPPSGVCYCLLVRK